MLIPAAAHAGDLDGLNEASGVNLTLEEGFGARQSGMGITFPSFQRDADAAVNAPASMNDVDDFTFSTSHAEKFGAAKFDNFSFLFPFESNSTMGLGIARYGVSDIPFFRDGVSSPGVQPTELFSVADYLVAAGFARRWGGLDLGFNFNLLYRQSDQDGIGMRGDAMAQYTWDRRFRISTLMKGLIPSSASWESGYAEYEATDIFIGGAALFPVPYFYGRLEVAWQSEGLVHKRAKSATSLAGSRFTQPADVLAASNLGLEFLFDFGMAVRIGATELNGKSPASTATFGLGYNWQRILGLDYSFTPHPELLASHRVSLQFTPAFPKFTGRNFRKPSASAPSQLRNPPGATNEGTGPALRQPEKMETDRPGPGSAEKPAQVRPVPGADTQKEVLEEVLESEEFENP